MRLKVFILTFLLFSGFCYSQTVITLQVGQSFGVKAKLFQFEGQSRVAIDSCMLNGAQEYRFELAADAPQGQYRLQVGRSGIIDLLVAGEPEIALKSVAYAIDDSLVVLKSTENQIFLRYMRAKRDKEQREWLIESLMKFYPDSSRFVHALRTELARLTAQFREQATTLASYDPKLLVSNYIHLDLGPQEPIPAPHLPNAANARAWWDGVDLTRKSLLNTPLLEKKLWQFTDQLRCEKLYDKELQDSVFVQNLGNLLERPMALGVRRLLVGSLALGFAESDYYPVMDYLIEHGGPLAHSLTDDPDVQQRRKLERNIDIGAKVLDFSFIPEGATKKTKLSAVGGQYKLLYFWSVWCPHCLDILPDMMQLYERYHEQGLEIIGISVDVDNQSLETFIQDQGVPWINTTFTNKNEEKLATNFNVDGTPKMILLDQKLRVISKPSTYNQLANKLLQIFRDE